MTGWTVSRAATKKPGPEPLTVRVDAEYDLSVPEDRAEVGALAAALRNALDTSANSWAGGAP